MKTILLAIAFFGVAASGAMAASVDQSNDGPDALGLNGDLPSLEWQQQVTAGTSGQLTMIDLLFNAPLGSGDVRVFVNLGAGWQSDAAEYDAVTNVGGGWTSFDLSGAGINLNAGDMFSIGVQGTGGTGLDLRGTVGNQYAGGALFLNGSLFNADYDMNFRTFVEPEPVPLPAALPLLGGGLALMGALRARRRARAAAA